jgi:hypothetical protein
MSNSTILSGVIGFGTAGSSGTSGTSTVAGSDGTSGTSGGTSGTSGSSGTSSTSYTLQNVLEDRTSDYAASAANSGKLWMRSDLTTATVKGVIKYTNSGTAAYIVKTFTIS